MKGKLIGFIGIIGLIFFLLAIFPSNLFAGEYGFIYKFKQPVVRDLGNGSQIVELENTRQNDAVIGAPLLPVRGTKIFIPAEEKVTSISVNPGALKSIEGTYTIQHATRPYPISYQGPIKLDEPDPDIYSTDADYPSVIQVERGSQYLCGTQIVLVDLSPVVYNPVRGELKYYDKIEVTIQTEWQGRPGGVRPFRNLPADRKQILRTIDNKNDFLLLNPAPASQGQNSLSPEKSSGGAEIVRPAAARDYVVITTSAMISAFTNLTNHRQSAAGGSFTTHIEDIANILVTYSGVDDAEKMRNFIIDMNDNYGAKYVVLGGDCDGAHGTQTISTRGCYALVNGGSPPDDDPDHYIPADLYFGCLDGTWNNDGDSLWGESNDGVEGADIDWESEVYVGRIPANNATEATAQINKIIAYETGSPPYKTLLVGENMDSTPTWGGDRMDWVYGYMNSMPKTELYDRDHASNNWPKSDLLTHINSNNHNWLNHMGHANPTWNMKLANADVASMTNSQYFFHYTQACYSGSIDGRGWGPGATYITGDCVLEDMVNSNNHGAFAIIGNSRYGWYNSGSFVQGVSNLAHKEFVEAIFTDGDKRLGEANQKSKPQLDLTQGVYRWIAFETNLLGCPATEMEIQPSRVLWNQPVSSSNTNAYADQDFETANNTYDTFNADDFTNTESWTIDTIYVPGITWNTGCNLTCATSLNFYIYANSSGIPAGYPDGGLGGSGTPIWSLSVPPSDSRVTLSAGVGAFQTNVTLSLTAPINLSPGTYWFVFYPELSFSGCSCQYGSHVSDTTNGYQGKVINPGDGFGHGATSWMNMTTFHSGLGLTQTDWAFRLEGTTGAAFGDELAVDFKTLGIYVYNTGIWNRIYKGIDPQALCSFGTYLAADFGTSYGLYVYDAGAWTRAYKGVAIEKMAGFGGKLAVDFGTTYPMYEYNFATDTWNPIYKYSSPRDTIEALGDKLVVDFKTAGIYVYDAGIWNRIYKGVDPVNIVSFGDKLAIDFGITYGLYVYKYDTDTWTRVYKGVAIEKMAEIDGDLVVDFGTAHGLYVYEFDTDNWTRVYKGVAIEKMAGFDGNLAVDFGTSYPIYEYNFGTDNWNSIYNYSSPRDELVPANIF